MTIAQIGLIYEAQSSYYQKVLNSIVHAFCKSISFEIANAYGLAALKECLSKKYKVSID